MQIASYILLTVTAAAILEFVFGAPRGSLWLRLTPALIGLSACGIFQVAIFQFAGRVRVPAGYFHERPEAVWWVFALPAACLTVAITIFLRQAFTRTSASAMERRSVLAWSSAVWVMTVGFLTIQFLVGRSAPAP